MKPEQLKESQDGPKIVGSKSGYRLEARRVLIRDYTVNSNLYAYINNLKVRRR
jgi:hypothetical protein